MGTKATAILIFLLSLWSFAILSPQEPTNPQSVTRLALALSILDRHTADISPFAAWTVDRATVGGHYFADKTPGHPLLALPAVAAAERLRQALGEPTDTSDPTTFVWIAKWAAIGSNGIISAAAVAVLFLTALALGASRTGALLAAITLGWGTPFLTWSTAFFAHSVTGSFLLFSLGLLLLAFRPNRPARPWLSLVAGLILGYTIVVDLTAAPAVLLLGGFATLRAWRSHRLPALLPMAIGGALGLVPLLVYNQLVFGAVWHLGYADTDFVGMQQGFFGLTWPHPDVAVQLLFGVRRGLLPLAPVLVFLPLGFWRMRGQGGIAALILVVALAYLAINASYYYWDGGASVGPRHLVATLALLALVLAFAWPQRWWTRALFLVLLGVSLVISLVCAAGAKLPPETYDNPLVDFLLPRALDPLALAREAIVASVWLVLALLVLRLPKDEPVRRGSAAAALPSVE